jgi:hypothetical protein
MKPSPEDHDLAQLWVSFPGLQHQHHINTARKMKDARSSLDGNMDGLAD